MAPPPRPPIICYDLQTNTNVRRAPCARYRVPLNGANHKTKVTVVQRDQNELDKASACWHHYNFNLDEREPQNLENIPTSRSVRLNERKQNARDRPRPNRRSSNKDLFFDSGPYQFNSNPFGGCQPSVSKFNNNNTARFAYSQKLKHEAEERERRREHKRSQIAMQAQLEEITAQLESAKRVQENLLKTFGMSHNTAKYIQQQDEDFARLRKKVDQFSETRSRELGRRVQQMKRFHELQQNNDKKAEDKRLRDMSKLTHCKHTLSSTLNNSLSSSSPVTNNTTTNTSSLSSTISISSCSSPVSTDEPIPSIHFVEPPPSNMSIQTTPPTSDLLPSSTPSKSHNNTRGNQLLPKQFSFYKRNPFEYDETLEVTDVDFFDKVEDKTMIEVNELLNKMQSVLKDLNHELQEV